MAIGAFGTLLTAAYMLIVVRRVCMGEHTPHSQLSPGAPPTQPADAPRTPGPAGAPTATTPQLADIQSYEAAAWTPLAALTVLAGLWPAVLLGLTDPAVQKLLAGGKS